MASGDIGGITGFPIGGFGDIGMTPILPPTSGRIGIYHGSGAQRTGATSMPPPTAGSQRSSSAARLRPRSRDRGGRYPRASMQFQAEERYRTQPAGPQEEQDWTVALESVTDRFDTLERMSRLHGQSIYHIEEDRAMLLG